MRVDSIAVRGERGLAFHASSGSRHPPRCQATLGLVAESPFTEVTVDPISNAAGLARSTFYLHFRDKFDVLRAMTEEVIQGLVETLTAVWMATVYSDRVRAEGEPG